MSSVRTVQKWSTVRVENSGFLECDRMSVDEYIRLYPGMVVPSSAGFFLRCLTLKTTFRDVGNDSTYDTTSHPRRLWNLNHTAVRTSDLETLAVFVQECSTLPDVRHPKLVKCRYYAVHVLLKAKGDKCISAPYHPPSLGS